jgi:hypothetical protein
LRDFAGTYICLSRPARVHLGAMCSLLSFVALLPLIFLLVLIMFSDIVGRADVSCAIDMYVPHTQVFAVLR